MLTPPSGLIINMDSYTRNPTAKVSISWDTVLASGEWFVLDQSQLDTGAILTQSEYEEGETILEGLSDIDSRIYADETEYLISLQGFSELIGDSYQYSISDMDIDLDNTDNRYTPRENKNKLQNPGFEFNKTDWNEVLLSNVVIDSYSESNSDSEFNISGVPSAPNTSCAQSFSGDGGTLNKATFYLKKADSPTGNAYAKIYAHSGTFGTSSIPTGSPLATSDALDVSSLTTSLALVEFPFTGENKITLADGTKYCISIEYSSGGGAFDTKRIIVGYDSVGSHNGNFSNYSDQWYIEASYDLCFYVYKDPVEIKIDENNPNLGIRDLQINNSNGSYVFSNVVPIYETDGYNITPTIEDETWTLSFYVTGSGMINLNLLAYGLTASGVSGITTGYIAGTAYQYDLG